MACVFFPVRVPSYNFVEVRGFLLIGRSSTIGTHSLRLFTSTSVFSFSNLSPWSGLFGVRAHVRWHCPYWRNIIVDISIAIYDSNRIHTSIWSMDHIGSITIFHHINKYTILTCRVSGSRELFNFFCLFFFRYKYYNLYKQMHSKLRQAAPQPCCGSTYTARVPRTIAVVGLFTCLERRCLVFIVIFQYTERFWLKIFIINRIGFTHIVYMLRSTAHTHTYTHEIVLITLIHNAILRERARTHTTWSDNGYNICSICL